MRALAGVLQGKDTTPETINEFLKQGCRLVLAAGAEADLGAITAERLPDAGEPAVRELRGERGEDRPELALNWTATCARVAADVDQTGGLERLVCALANYKEITVRKNCAVTLAKAMAARPAHAHEPRRRRRGHRHDHDAGGQAAFKESTPPDERPTSSFGGIVVSGKRRVVYYYRPLARLLALDDDRPRARWGPPTVPQRCRAVFLRRDGRAGGFPPPRRRVSGWAGRGRRASRLCVSLDEVAHERAADSSSADSDAGDMCCARNAATSARRATSRSHA